MQEITTLTNSPKQRWTLVLDNNETAEFYLYYLIRNQAWYFDIDYKNFSAKCLKCVLTPNAMRSFRRILPFGIAFLSDDVLDPYQIDDFSSGRVKMYTLNKDEVENIEKEIYYA
jgi:hypothetical protein